MALTMTVDGFDASSIGFDVVNADTRRAFPRRSWVSRRTPLSTARTLLSEVPEYEERELVVQGRLTGSTEAEFYSRMDELRARLDRRDTVEISFSDKTDRVYDARLIEFDHSHRTMAKTTTDNVTLVFALLDPWARDHAASSLAFGSTPVEVPLGTAPVEDHVIRVHGPFTDPSIKLSQAGLFHLEDGAGIEPSSPTFSRASTATYTDAAGRVRTAASGDVRKHHYVDDEDGDRTQARKLEASRTNSLTRSEEFDHADWTKSGVTVTADDGTDPEGGSTADLLTPGSSGDYVEQAETVADDSLDRAKSVYVAKNESTAVRLEARYSGGTTAVTEWIELDTTDGTTTTSGGETRADVEDVGDFYRLWIVVANNGTGNTTLTWRLIPDNSATTAIHAWGAQLEGLSGGVASPSSYIATTTAAVTRSADSLSYGIGFGPQELTFYTKIINRGTQQVHTARVFEIGDATSPRLLLFARNGTEFRFFHDGGGGGGGPVLVVDANVGDVIEFFGTLYADGDVQFGWSKNGGAVTSSNRAPTSALGASWSADKLSVGEDGAGGNKGFADFIALTIAQGVKTMDEMRALDNASGDVLFQTDFTLTQSEGDLVELDFGAATITDGDGNSLQADRDTGTDWPWPMEPQRGEQQSGDYPKIEVTDGDGELIYHKRWS